MASIRKQIEAIARKFDGKLITQEQANFLRDVLGSLNDTLTDREVLNLLEAIPADFSMVPRDELLQAHIGKYLEFTTTPPPPLRRG